MFQEKNSNPVELVQGKFTRVVGDLFSWYQRPIAPQVSSIASMPERYLMKSFSIFMGQDTASILCMVSLLHTVALIPCVKCDCSVTSVASM